MSVWVNSGEGSLAQLKRVADGMGAAEPDGSHLCKDCVKGRMRERPHDGTIQPGTYPMESIHVDIAELPVPGYDGNRYAVTKLDDFTEWAELTPAKRRSEFFEHVRYFVEHNETPTHRCKRIRLDRAGENQAATLRAWAYSKGIELDYTDTEQHQANGRAERLNRTMGNKLQSTMQSAGIPDKYWPLVLPYHSVYVRNRSPCTKKLTPFELFTKRRPNLANIPTLGSKVYVLRPEKDRLKWLGSRVTEGVLLGFKGNHQYLVLFPDKSFTWRTNVIFEEQLHSSTCGNTNTLRQAPDETPEPGEEKVEPQAASSLTDIAQAKIEVMAADDPNQFETTLVFEEGESDLRGNEPPVARPNNEVQRRSSRAGRVQTSRYDSAVWQVSLRCIMLASNMSEPYEPRTLSEARASAQWSK